MMFGLKVKKKKKKKVDTDLVLANKGALGEAWKINTPTHKLTVLVSCTLCTMESFFPVASQPLSNSHVTNSGLHNEGSCEPSRPLAATGLGSPSPGLLYLWCFFM